MHIDQYFTIAPDGKVVLKTIVKNDALLQPLVRKHKDNEGRLYKDLQFMYHFCNKELYEGLNLDERVRTIKRAIGLDSTWTPCAELQKVCNEFIDMHQSESERSLSLLKAILIDFIDTLTIVKDENKANRERIAAYKLTDLTKEQAEAYKTIIESMESSTKNVLDYATKIPKAIMALSALEKEVKKEVSQNKQIGGRTVVNSFDD
jgi:hypothetical protein